MGAYWTTYLGVYLEVQEGTETKTHAYYIDHNGDRKDTVFCPDTGAKYQLMTEEQEIKVYPSPYGFEDIDDDAFFNPEYSGAPDGWRTWLPNTSNYRVAKMEQHEDNKNHQIDSIDIEKMISDFVDDNEDYLEKIGDKFNFIIKFGLVHYAH